MSAEVLREAAAALRDEWGGPDPMGTAWHRERDLHLAVADWLDSEAAKVSEWTVTQMGRPVHYSTGRVSDYALAVARAYLGLASP